MMNRKIQSWLYCLKKTARGKA